jgi:general stress protein 26
MATQHTDFDGTLWFFTREHSAKVEEVSQRRQVSVTYSDPHEQTYVAIAGTAEVVRDEAKMKELWHPLRKAWFPKGLGDPELSLLRVTVDRAEYWDAYNSTLVQIVGFAKALVTGEPYAPGDHKVVSLAGAEGS